MRLPGPTIARLQAVLASLAMVFVACGEADDETTVETTGSATSATTEARSEPTETETTETVTTEPGLATTEETEPPPTEPAATEETATTDTDGADADAAVPIELTEWSISDPGELAPGTITFALDNTGENRHALAIARGATYEDLPRKQNGAVDTDALGDDYLGTSDTVDSGATGTVVFDLEAGDHVFFCPIEFGPNSHARAGQVLGVTVAS